MTALVVIVVGVILFCIIEGEVEQHHKR